jgi:biotin carboxyl carrier protein
LANHEIITDVTGTVWKIERKVGDRVAEGDVIMILESMKMEIPVEATVAGTIVEIMVKEEQPVAEGDVVCSVAP